MHNEAGSHPSGDFSETATPPSHWARELCETIEHPMPTWQVRRAEAYIATHWNEPITMASLARATAASPRSIFYHFKNCRGQSPMSFVKQVRLEQARKMLKEGGFNHSVTEIAIDCGFGNLGHFAGDYYKRFGEHPSETLKRSKSESATNDCALFT